MSVKDNIKKNKRERSKDLFTKQKSRYSQSGKRENFLQLYNRTCHVIYFYCFECCHNRRDAEMILRDSYIYMFEHIAELRHAESVDSWQKECVQKSFRALLRSQLLNLVEDDTDYTISSTLSESKKEELWERIVKMSDIDPWRLIPIPGKSTIFSVIADQTMSDMRYMSPLDIVRSAAIILVAVAAVVAVLIFGISYIQKAREGALDPMQEVFMDERYYDGYEIVEAESVDESLVDQIFNQAAKKDVDDEGKHTSYTYPSTIGNTAGAPKYTEDVEINTQLIAIIKEVITDDMSDFRKLEALYEYVGKNSTYQEYDQSGDDELSLLRDYFAHGGGTSQHYAAVLSALINAAGYRCEVIEGNFILNRDTEFERSIRHYWNKMSLNGIVYYLDIEADSSADGTQVRKYYFMAADGNSRWDIYTRDHVQR